MSEKALILLVHGSRDPKWLEPFESIASDVSKKSADTQIAIASLQYSQPDLKQSITALAEKGTKSIRVLPFFISTKGHVLKDVPPVIEEVKKSFPNLEIKVLDAIGEMPEIQTAFRECIVNILKIQ
jgi:sirohydrochlorin cobaltochelatase